MSAYATQTNSQWLRRLMLRVTLAPLPSIHAKIGRRSRKWLEIRRTYSNHPIQWRITTPSTDFLHLFSLSYYCSLSCSTIRQQRLKYTYDPNLELIFIYIDPWLIFQHIYRDIYQFFFKNQQNLIKLYRLLYFLLSHVHYTDLIKNYDD